MQGLVAVLQVHVLADHADADGAVRRLLELLDRVAPLGELGLARPDVEALGDLIVEPFGVEHERQLVDARDVHRRDHALHRHVREERDLLLQARRDRAIAATDQDVRLDADLRISRTECWVGLVLSSPAVTM